MALRAGICGIDSFYSTAFLGACRSNANLTPVACTSPGASPVETPGQAEARRAKVAAWAKERGLAAYDSVEEMVRKESLDVVFVASADNVKAAHAAEAADAGAHVFLAKPMCLTLQDADRIIEAGKRGGAVISALMPGRYDGAIRSLYNEVAQGAVGDVLTVRAWVQHGCFGPGMSFEGSPEFGPEQGGIPLSLGFYAADLILWLIDSKPLRAYAEYDNLATPHSIWMDTGKGVVRFADGRMGSMDIIFNVECGAPPWELEVVGTKGIARAHLDVYEGIIWRSGARPGVLYRNQNDVIGAAVSAFVKACLECKKPEVTAEHGRNVLELSLAWKRSAETHAPVYFPLEGKSGQVA